MARTTAISLIKTGTTKVDLAELSGLVIENIQKETVSSGLKSQAYTGNPATGSVEFKRFKNSASDAYGTARGAGAGTAITVPPTTVNLNTHREIVEEAAKFDLDTFGVGNIMARRADNHVDTVAAELDAAFFAQAVSEGTAFETELTKIEEIVESMIQTLETVKNDYVRGVPRNKIRLVLDPVYYGKIRNYLDNGANNANVDSAAEDFAMFHGVRVYSSINLPVVVDEVSGEVTTTHAIIMVEGAIAQPAIIYPYAEPEKIPLSNDYGISMFFDYGTKALTPDLIFFYEEQVGTLGSLTVTSTDSDNAGKTVITVSEEVPSGHKLVYKTDASTAPEVNYGDILTAGWTELPDDGEISATNGHKITVAEIDGNDKAKKSGNTTIVVE